MSHSRVLSVMLLFRSLALIWGLSSVAYYVLIVTAQV